MNKRTYYAAVEGFIHGAYRKVGDSLGQLTERQAKYLLMSGLVTTQSPKGAERAEPDPTTIGKKTR